jgi:low temperature requirement protein LtrA
VRVGTLLATAFAFLMAASVSEAFEERGGLWFAVPYILIRLLGLSLYARVATEREGQLEAVRAFALLSMLGLGAVFIGGLVDPDLRMWFWLGAIGLDVFASRVAGRFESWHLHVEHFTERHGLFVIIALGESLIISASVVTDSDRSTELVLAAIGTVLVTCLLWWTYFGWLKDGLEERFVELRGSAQSSYARDAYSLLHWPLIGGVIGVAVGFEEMLAHPKDSLDGEILLALGIGLALFLGAGAATWAWASRQVLRARIAAVAVLAIGLPLAEDVPAVWILTIVAVTLAVVVFDEARTNPRLPGHQPATE